MAILAVFRGAARDIYRRPMDAVDPALVDTAEPALRAVPGVVDVEAHAIASEAHHQLLHGVPRLVDALVHTSPCGPEGRAHDEASAHHSEHRDQSGHLPGGHARHLSFDRLRLFAIERSNGRVSTLVAERKGLTWVSHAHVTRRNSANPVRSVLW